MTQTLESLTASALTLSDSDREMLANILLDSLPDTDDETPEFTAMLDRRRVEHESGRSPGIPGEEFLARWRRKK